MIVHIKDLVSLSRQKQFTLGAFNLHNLETAVGIVRAGVNKRAPLILQMSEGTIHYLGLQTLTSALFALADELGGDIPFALHLDHGKDEDLIKQCIAAGFSSVHIDRSDLPLVENIKITKRVVDFAHSQGVWVQGEVGRLLGGHGEQGSLPDEVPLADPDEVKRFVEETGVDTITAAVGTAHGIFTNEKINIVLIKQIKAVIADRPLVLHGASGTKESDLQSALQAGVNIVNVGSDIKYAFTSTVIKTALNNQSETDPRKLLKPAIAAVTSVVEKKLELFGAVGKID